MASIADGKSEHDPSYPAGWISQVLAACRRALFEESWAPWVRLMVTVIVTVALYKVMFPA